ncbi:hypothetical protein RND81_01G116300 [Saponaria officinalis]|uniref:CASP-like protein n=1 Tax=Saponaria officinalis TaxID=3572 RepID=A0AAW1NEG9_SAPOF
MGGKSGVAICRIVATSSVILILVCLALEIRHDNAVAQLLKCKAAAAAAECVECAYFRIAALFLLLAAFLLAVFLAQFLLTISDHSHCFRVLYTSSAFQAVAILAFSFSLCSCVSATIVYMIGEAKQYGVRFPNSGHILLSMNNIIVEDSYCYKIKNGIFGAASLLSFAGVSLGIICYLALTLGDISRLRFQANNTTTDCKA